MSTRLIVPKMRVIVLLTFSFYTFLFLPLIPLWAQSDLSISKADLISPVIQHDRFSSSLPTGSQVMIRATLTDNVGVKSAILFYRLIGTDLYKRLDFTPQGNDLYVAVLPIEVMVVPGIEYYLQVSDAAENIAMRGFSFSPLILTVSPFSPTTSPAESEPIFSLVPQEKKVVPEPSPANPWYKRWWVVGTAGAMIGGLIVAGMMKPDTYNTGVSGPVLPTP